MLALWLSAERSEHGWPCLSLTSRRLGLAPLAWVNALCVWRVSLTCVLSSVGVGLDGMFRCARCVGYDTALLLWHWQYGDRRKTCRAFLEEKNWSDRGHWEKNPQKMITLKGIKIIVSTSNFKCGRDAFSRYCRGNNSILTLQWGWVLGLFPLNFSSNFFSLEFFFQRLLRTSDVAILFLVPQRHRYKRSRLYNFLSIGGNITCLPCIKVEICAI